MDELIRRSATAKDLREYAERKAQVNGIEYANGILAAACRIEQAIPAVDAVEVCRCQDCRWYDTDDGDLKCVKDAEWDEDAAMYTGLISYHLEDFYCADGQRREDGDE